jgi:hypothetical protein
VTLGILPFLLYRSAEFIFAPYLVWSGLASWWATRRFVSRATTEPTLLEWIIAWWSAVGKGATVSMIGYLWYGIVYGIVWCVVFAANAINWEISLEPSSGATVASWVFFGAFGLAVPILIADELASKLYPSIAGIRSPFFEFASKPGLLMVVPIVGIVFFAALIWNGLDPKGLWFTLLLAVFLVGTSAPLQEPAADRKDSAAGREVYNAVRRLFLAAGYRLIERPRTDDRELDPLIAAIDLVAVSDRRTYAVQIVFAALDSEAGIDESNIFEVKAGARALHRAAQSSEESDRRVVPYLFVVGGEINDSQRELSRELMVSVVHLPDSQLLRPAATVTELSSLRETALRALQVPLAGDPIPLESSEQSAQVRQ